MPVVALLTDFGNQDHYVGAMKGSILTVCPEATLVDLAHEIPAHDVAAGAYALASSWRDFPPRSVFVAVVDPGVGSARRGLALEAGGYCFVGPDNGHPLARDGRRGGPGRAARDREPVALARGGLGDLPRAGRVRAGGGPPRAGPRRSRGSAPRSTIPSAWRSRSCGRSGPANGKRPCCTWTASGT